MDRLSRRDLLRSAGAAAAAAAVPGAATSAAAQPAATPRGAAGAEPDVLFFFNTDEARFIQTAVDRLIPGDEQWGGAEQAGVLYFIDRQLGSAYGAGARMYLKGPWAPDAPMEQGYQLKYTPAQLYRTAIEEIRPKVRNGHGGHELWELAPEQVDGVLSSLESGGIELPSMPSAVFFETLLANTIEGYLSDPAYGGNRGMVSWRMIGFPGAYAEFAELVDQYDYPYARAPLGIASSPVQLAHSGRAGGRGT